MEETVRGVITRRKSSYSGSNSGECVELGACGQAAFLVRDSKNPDGPVLRADVAALVRAVKAVSLD